MNQQGTFLSDGGDTVRDLQLYLNPQAEHLLDWFHPLVSGFAAGARAPGGLTPSLLMVSSPPPYSRWIK
jgi:hypothetical protein